MTLAASARERAASYALGYESTQEGGSYLPARISIITPIATAKQSGFSDYDKPKAITSFKQFFDLYGECPGAQILRILKPVTGGGTGPIPIDVFPIADSYGATAATGDITPSGTATSSNTHYVKFNGRKTINGRTCGFAVVEDDTYDEVMAKMLLALQGFLYSSVTAVDGTTKINITSNWKGILANEISITIDTNDDDCGMSYGINNPSGAVGDGDVTDAYGNMGNVWYTHDINLWADDNFDVIESINGRPDIDTNGTGRWNGQFMKPFISFYGSVESDPDTLKALVTSRKLDLTNVICPAPESLGYTWEAAANMIRLSAVIMNSSPHKEISALAYADMPDPDDGYIGTMQNWDVRDDLVANGISTVTYNDSEGYVVQSLITPRRPDSQSPLAIDFSYVRDIYVDMNVAYNYKIQEKLYLLDKTVLGDTDIATVDDVIKPKTWKSILFDLVDDLADLALLADRNYAKSNMTVEISSTDPQRINTKFYYKRSGIARKSSTNAYAGFNFGD